MEDLFTAHRTIISRILNKPWMAAKNGELISCIFNGWLGKPPFLCYIHQGNGCMILTDGKESTLIVDTMRHVSKRYLRKLQEKCRLYNVKYYMTLESGEYVGESPAMEKTIAWNAHHEQFREKFEEVRKTFYGRIGSFHSSPVTFVSGNGGGCPYHAVLNISPII